MPVVHLKLEQPDLYRMIEKQARLSPHLSEAIRDYERAAAHLLEPHQKEIDRGDWTEIKKELTLEILRLLGGDPKLLRSPRNEH